MNLPGSKVGHVSRQPYPSPPTQISRGARAIPARVEEMGRHAHLIGIEARFEKATVMSNDCMKPPKRHLADIYATKKSLHRVIEMANELYLHIESKG